MILLTLTGCRLGNRVQRAAQPESITGLYGTEPTSFEVCVGFKGGGEACVSPNTNLIPAEIGAVFSNPVGVIVDEKTGDALFTNPFYSSSNAPALPTFLELPAKTISFQGAGQQPTVPTEWLPPEVDDCITRLDVVETGVLTDKDKGKVMYESELSGRVELEVTVMRTFVGNECEDTIAFLEDCYADASLCMGTGPAQNSARQVEVAGLYHLFLESGAMLPSQIGGVIQRKYKVQYR